MIADSLFYVVAKIVPGALGIATTALLTRHYRPADYGAYGATLVMMMFGSSMLFDWIGLAFMRLYEARRHDPATIPTFIALFGATLIATAGLACVVQAAQPRTDRNDLWLAGLAMMWAFSLFELLARFEIADFRPRRYLAMNVGRGVLMLAASAGIVRAGLGPAALAGASASALLAACLLARPRRMLPRQGLFDRALAAEAIGFGLPYAASMTLLALTTTGTRAVVGAMAGPDALGLYTAGFAVSQNVLVMIAAGIGAATYPAAVRAIEAEGLARVRAQLEANATVLLAVLAPASLGMAMVADGLAALMVGPAYAGTVARLIPWMAAAAFLGGLRACYLDHAFQLGRRPGLQIRVAALAALVGVGGAALLVPRLGVEGAAVAAAAAMAVSCVHAARLGRLALPLPVPWRGATLVLGGCLALAVAVRLAGGHGVWSLAREVGAGGLAYGTVMLGAAMVGSGGAPWRSGLSAPAGPT